MANRETGTITEEQSRLFALVGLGNPGPEYEATRHNAGFWLLDAWTELHRGEISGNKWANGKTCEYLRVRLSQKELILVRPLRFMNRSGEASIAILRFFKVPLEHTLVAYDDLDLAPGIARLRFGGSSGGHRGVQDFAKISGSDAFYRLRLGIGHPRTQEPPGGAKGLPADVTAWVLGRPPKEERVSIARAVGQGAEAVDWWLHEGFQPAQQKLHSLSK